MTDVLTAFTVITSRHICVSSRHVAYLNFHNAIRQLNLIKAGKKCKVKKKKKEPSTTSSFATGWNLSLIKPLDLAAHLQGMPRPEEQVELHREKADDQIHTAGTSAGQAAGLFFTG